jgi:hypothetical protein
MFRLVTVMATEPDPFVVSQTAQCRSGRCDQPGRSVGNGEAITPRLVRLVWPQATAGADCPVAGREQGGPELAGWFNSTLTPRT